MTIFERFSNLKYRYGNRHFWCRGYYVSTVGGNKEGIAKYIREQEHEDQIEDQISFKNISTRLRNKDPMQSVASACWEPLQRWPGESRYGAFFIPYKWEK